MCIRWECLSCISGVPQVNHVKIVADYVAELRRLGKGHGPWHFDRLLRDGTINPANAYTTNLAPPSYN